jgi:hypothetical protein
VIDTAPHGELYHGDLVEIACPDQGTLLVSCFDGTTTHESGKCFLGCPAGKLTDENGTVIEYSYIRHNESQAGACTGLAKGNVNLYCNDTVVTQRRLPGEQCLRACTSDPVKTPGDIFVIPPITSHGNQATVRCPNGQLGLLTMSCFDTEWLLLDGECGDMNCAEGVQTSNAALLPHLEINNGWKAGPTQCPSPYLGIATFACGDGKTTVDEVTMQLPVSPQDLNAIALVN